MHIESLRLGDGRRLGYAISIEEGGLQSALFCHGTPGSALQMPPGIKPVFVGHQFIIPERPGYGQSEPVQQTSLLSCAHDIVQLLDHLDIDRVRLIGYSGGGAYALACAHALTDRVIDISLCSSFSPLQVQGAIDNMCPPLAAMIDAAAQSPDGLLVQLESQPLDVEQLLESFLLEMTPADQQAVASVDIRRELISDFERALQAGFSGYVLDLLNLGKPWGFSLGDIKVPVQLYHGDADRNTPPAMAHYLSSALPNASLHWFEGKGHFLGYDSKTMSSITK